KVVPASIDPALSPGNLNALIAQKNIPSISPAWLGREDTEETSHEKAGFLRFTRDLEAMCEKHLAFSDWPAAEPREAKTLATALAKQLRPRLFSRTGLAWSPGRLGRAQKTRFFVSLSSMSVALGEGVWDVARRKALKAMASEPLKPRI